jgi:hypothetical protein
MCTAYFFIAWLDLSALSASATAEGFSKMLGIKVLIYETKPTGDP